MTNFVDLINRTADRFETVISSAPLATEIETEDFGWSNKRWHSSSYRFAHVERFAQPKFIVLHTVIFPHITDSSAIFGFDIIASDSKATGLFFDLSPTIEPTQPFFSGVVTQSRERPEWGSIFSEHWVACRPTFEEATAICDAACEVLQQYVNGLGKNSTHRVGDVVRAQNSYSLQQRQNEHTTRVIKRLLGEERGRYFVEEILFPVI